MGIRFNEVAEAVARDTTSKGFFFVLGIPNLELSITLY
jgi:hypothetical protein